MHSTRATAVQVGSRAWARAWVGQAGPQAPAHWRLGVYTESEDWGYLERTITIDSNDVIYLTDEEQIYGVADGVPFVHLSSAELEATVGVGAVRIKSLDVGPDDRLYEITANAVTELYPAVQFQGGTNCGSEDLIIDAE